MASGTFFKNRIRQFEKRCLIRILRKTGGNIRQAALLIDERRSRLYRILKRHGLKAQDFRHANDPR
jgi:transcriptional regulator of acetoin/glycerol metabolism